MATNNTSTYVLGVSFDYHDSSATILKMGKLLLLYKKKDLLEIKTLQTTLKKQSSFA